ncbi:MAG TPA: SLC13 family permease [Bryobacteraceae bacterium]|nr:SLC13 family permease [Bryobacteraceae bacterium]
MGAEAFVVLAAVGIVLILLTATRLPADAVLVAALTFLVFVPVPEATGWRMGVLNVSEAFSGFSNPGVLTVAVLFAVAAGLRQTGAIDWVAQTALGRPATVRSALARVVFPAVPISAFLNNTAVVAMLVPAISDWARKLRLPVSKLMLPFNYATVLGGTCTLIGTSTNLIVSGLVLSSGKLPPLGLFDVTWIGLPVALIGCCFVWLAGPFLLPDRGSPSSQLREAREYMAEMIVPPGSPLVGKTIEEAGLRHLPGAFVAEIERDGESLVAVGPEQRLKANDRLVLVGVVDSIRDLQQLRGLVPATDQVFKLDSPRYRRRLFEAVVSNTCPLVGKTIRDGRFRNRYNAVVLAVARNGERLRGKIGDIVLRPGDTLLIEAGPSFAVQQRDSRDFFLISGVEHSTPRRHERATVALAILAAMVVAAAAGVNMLGAALVAAFLMVATGCCSLSDARNSLEWPVLIAIGAALGLGRAMEVSGAAHSLAAAILSLAGQQAWLTLAAFYVASAVLTEILTNNAVAALMFPVALASAEQLGVSPLPFVMALMIAASAGFATPIGYQTNLMVYGPGGYRFGDYLRLGIPLDIVVGLTTVFLVPLIWPF